MSIKSELVGKTISGIVGVQDSDQEPARIWMLQFTDGTHVEFVSPKARRRIRRTAGAKIHTSKKPGNDAQLALNVA